MYFPTWMILVMISLWISLVAFIWGIVSGQFSDQDRARYLPFMAEKDHLQPVTLPSGRNVAFYFYVILIGTGVVFFALAMGMGIYFNMRG